MDAAEAEFFLDILSGILARMRDKPMQEKPGGNRQEYL